MYKKKKKWPIRQIALVCLLVVALILGLVVNIVKTDRQLTVFEKAIKDSVLSVTKVIGYPFDFVIHKINDHKNIDPDEYKKMKSQLDEAELIKQQNEELKRQLEELKITLELNQTLADYTLLNATIINRDMSYWQDTITIDKGEYSGITVGMPVVVSKGLIGKVVTTTTFTSTVRLITANNASDKISVKVKIGDNYAYGILNGYNEAKDTYTIEGVAQDILMSDDLVVTTTGMSDIFPSGIVIGKVVAISTDAFDLARVLEVKSEINFDDLNYVTIVKRDTK